MTIDDGMTIIDSSQNSYSMRKELTILRQRVKAQRKELKRLNKYLGPYWAGFNAGIASERETALRRKMINAFGHAAVYEAEHGKKSFFSSSDVVY